MTFFSKLFVLWIASIGWDIARVRTKISTLVFINLRSCLHFELICVQLDFSNLSCSNYILCWSTCLWVLISNLSCWLSNFILLRHSSSWRLVHKWLNSYRARVSFLINLSASSLGQISSIPLHGWAWRILLFLITHIFFYLNYLN